MPVVLIRIACDRIFDKKEKGRKKRKKEKGRGKEGGEKDLPVRAPIFTCWQRGTKGACSDTRLDVEQYISIERPIA